MASRRRVVRCSSPVPACPPSHAGISPACLYPLIPRYGPGGIGRAASRAQYAAHFLAPLHAAFADPALQIDALVCEGAYCGAHVRLSATHRAAWLGVPPTHKVAALRLGLHARIAVSEEERQGCDAPRDGCIAEAWAQLDVPAAFASVGVDILKSVRGA